MKSLLANQPAIKGFDRKWIIKRISENFLKFHIQVYYEYPIQSFPKHKLNKLAS